jgi:hypothetical protein
MTRSAGFLAAHMAALGCAAVLAACDQRAAPGAVVPLTEAERAGYLPGPVVLAVVVAPDGAPLVRGRARPLGRVRATLPSGEAYGATADSKGRFELELATGGGSVMALISAEDGGRSTPAEGWLFAPAGDFGRAVLLRAGSSSRAIASNAPLLAVVDFDAAGGAGISGRAAAAGEVRLFVDGVAAGSVQTDAEGRYSVRLAPPAAGYHRLRAASAGQSQERTVEFTPPTTPSAGPFAAARVGDAWRIDWTAPGGGLQTTYLFVGGAAS